MRSWHYWDVFHLIRREFELPDRPGEDSRKLIKQVLLDMENQLLN